MRGYKYTYIDNKRDLPLNGWLADESDGTSLVWRQKNDEAEKRGRPGKNRELTGKDMRYMLLMFLKQPVCSVNNVLVPQVLKSSSE